MTCVNMQAACDAKCRFLLVTCQHTGCCADEEAFQSSSLKDIVLAHIFPFHRLADNAYSLTNFLSIPYAGVDHLSEPEKEAFNFYHSQLRISIERAFGIFIRRFGIL